ncbi:MAG: hypothetical protein LBE27_06160 [Deltaproteobacteria bacterium]|jgi:hypothetical protein|nr:hypothetical protein [Deltaproteobacteria bacterium]
MSEELIVFLNFKFENNLVTTKILDDVSLKLSTATRHQLNWRAYLMALEKIGVYADSDKRPLSQRYLSPQMTEELYSSLVAFQEEMRGMITEISTKKRVSRALWKKIFRESDSLNASVSPPSDFDTDITTENIGALKLRLNYDSQTYRGSVMANLRDLIVSGRVFNVSLGEDGVFFMEDPPQKAPEALSKPESPAPRPQLPQTSPMRALDPNQDDSLRELEEAQKQERTFTILTSSGSKMELGAPLKPSGLNPLSSVLSFGKNQKANNAPNKCEKGATSHKEPHIIFEMMVGEPAKPGIFDKDENLNESDEDLEEPILLLEEVVEHHKEEPPPEEAPLEGIPLEDEEAPLEGMPLEGMPLEGMPLEGMPLEGRPLEGMLLEEEAPLEGMPLEDEAPLAESEEDEIIPLIAIVPDEPSKDSSPQNELLPIFTITMGGMNELEDSVSLEPPAKDGMSDTPERGAVEERLLSDPSYEELQSVLRDTTDFGEGSERDNTPVDNYLARKQLQESFVAPDTREILGVINILESVNAREFYPTYNTSHVPSIRYYGSLKEELPECFEIIKLMGLCDLAREISRTREANSLQRENALEDTSQGDPEILDLTLMADEEDSSQSLDKWTDLTNETLEETEEALTGSLEEQEEKPELASNQIWEDLAQSTLEDTFAALEHPESPTANDEEPLEDELILSDTIPTAGEDKKASHNSNSTLDASFDLEGFTLPEDIPTESLDTPYPNLQTMSSPSTALKYDSTTSKAELPLQELVAQSELNDPPPISLSPGEVAEDDIDVAAVDPSAERHLDVRAKAHGAPLSSQLASEAAAALDPLSMDPEVIIHGEGLALDSQSTDSEEEEATLDTNALSRVVEESEDDDPIVDEPLEEGGLDELVLKDIVIDELPLVSMSDEDEGSSMEELEAEPLLAEAPRAKKYKEIDYEETFILYDEEAFPQEEDAFYESATAMEQVEEDASFYPSPDFLPVEFLLSTLEQRFGKIQPRGGNVLN